MIRELLARILEPRSHCAGCGRPWFTDVRRPCHCGETARIVGRRLHDSMAIKDKTGARRA